MIDNEIIKALECCVECDMYCDECAEDCPLKDTNDCTYVLRRNSLDLINRQKAEIERLQKHNKEYGFCNLLGNCLVYSKNLKDYNDMRKGLKAGAYKEFAERASSLCSSIVLGGKYTYEVITKEGIAHILKELTEGNGNEN